MAIYHLRAKCFSRAKGQSAIAAASYRSGLRLIDFAAGEVKDYPPLAERVLWQGVFAPAGAPAWVHDPQQLWNNVERLETRCDSTLCREVEFSLPMELTHEQRRLLAVDFIRETFVRRGLVVHAAIHIPIGLGGGDPRNYHCHALIVERPLVDGVFGNKDRSLQEPETLLAWRERWQTICNRYLERHRHAARIDHRTLLEQGISREPTIHIGQTATAMERRGQTSVRGDRARAINARNARLYPDGYNARAIDRALSAAAQLAAAEPTHDYEPDEDLVPRVDVWGIGQISPRR